MCRQTVQHGVNVCHVVTCVLCLVPSKARARTLRLLPAHLLVCMSLYCYLVFFVKLCVPPQGRTPLHRAVAAGHVEIVKLLISKQEVPAFGQGLVCLAVCLAVPEENCMQNCLQQSPGFAEALGAGGRVHEWALYG